VTAAPSQLAAPAPPAARWDGDAARDARQRLWQDLCGKYPPRPEADDWDATGQAREQVTSRLAREPFRLPNRTSQFHRQRGTALILDWLEAQPGRTWQQRWAAAGAAESSGPGWRRLAFGWHRERGLASLRPRSFDLVTGAGLVPLVCADVIRPGAGWLLGAGAMRGLAGEMERTRDRDGFAALRRADTAAPGRQSLALRQVAAIMAAKGGTVADITVGDCLELLAAAGRAGAGPNATSVYFYQLLHAAGMLPGSAPATVRAFRTRGQLSPAQMTGLYGIECQPVRQLLADYLTERQPAMDYASLRSLASTLCRLFWRDLEIHHPGISSLRLDPAAASAWRERLLAKTVTRRTPGGQLTSTTALRTDALNPLTAVRAFYLDIAEWAIEDPARWGPWAAPCPVRSRDMTGKKLRSRRKARMDQRTRERLPLLPQLVAAAAAASAAARDLLDAAGRAEPGQEFTAAGQTLRRAVLTRGTSARTLADDPAGRRRDLTLEEHRAFWTWAAIEVLRHTGIRIEELTELSHHSLIQYRLPGTGELIPLLQIAPSKTDAERLLVISPELADVLSAIVCRIRGAGGAVPLAVAYDTHERTWLPPMPLLFQRRMRAEHRPIPAQAIRDLLVRAVASLGITGPDGTPLRYSPHDFRRMFITDAITHGMPPHIAQLVAGHRDINTTLGYKAVYPQEIIAGHRAFIARRRALRPSEEYRVPTEQEWDQFLGHFEHRKLSIGTCGRSYNTPCIHEHACIRCPLLRPDPAQKSRLTEIRANLVARIAEAEREGWTGEAEGLKASLAAAGHKLAQMNQITASRNRAVDLGMPAFVTITGRTVTIPPTHKPDTR
jgi:hypothetical protein